MKKYFIIGLLMTALISTSCADDMPVEEGMSRSYNIKTVGNDTIVTDTLVYEPNTVFDNLRLLYEETWACIIGNDKKHGDFAYEEDPDIEDMVIFLKWAAEEYEWVHDSSYFDEVASIIATKSGE